MGLPNVEDFFKKDENASSYESIKNMDNIGRAIGMSMKTLKQAQAVVDGKTVKVFIEKRHLNYAELYGKKS